MAARDLEHAASLFALWKARRKFGPCASCGQLALQEEIVNGAKFQVRLIGQKGASGETYLFTVMVAVANDIKYGLVAEQSGNLNFAKSGSQLNSDMAALAHDLGYTLVHGSSAALFLPGGTLSQIGALLEREGRGITMFAQKWQYAMRKWDDEITRAAQKNLADRPSVVIDLDEIFGISTRCFRVDIVISSISVSAMLPKDNLKRLIAILRIGPACVLGAPAAKRFGAFVFKTLRR